MNKLIAMTLMGAAMMATPAMAEDFTGPRIEARVGIDAAHITANSASATGLTYGGAVGYDFALTPHVRLGATVAVDSSTASQSFSSLASAGARRDIEVGGRLGYVVSPSTMVYAMAAYSNNQTGWAISNKGVVAKGTQLDSGYRLGGGAEFAITKHLYTKVEYRYTDYSGGHRTNQILTGLGIRF